MKSLVKPIIFIMLILIGIGALYLYVQVRTTQDFDQKYLSGSISFPESAIGLGQTASPTLLKQGIEVPYGESLGSIPRYFSLSGIRSFRLAKSATSIHVLTDFPAPEMIIVQMPLHSGGYVNIYGPEGAEITLIIWQE